MCWYYAQVAPHDRESTRPLAAPEPSAPAAPRPPLPVPTNSARWSDLDAQPREQRPNAPFSSVSF
jgi:hypothetical protein